jgi:energy-coupling factor transporter ATP-binding protein EcfA2
MEIEFKNKLKIKGIDVDCKLILENSASYLISGGNGIGKSSFLQYLKLHKNEYFNCKRTCFVDQFPLRPINDVSLESILRILNDERYENLGLFEDYKGRVSLFSKIPINHLSGGQNQMVKIMISLYLSGDIFVFDEPLQYLDDQNVEGFIETIKALKKMNKTILIVEHRSDLLTDVIDKRLTMKQSGSGVITIRENNGI